MNKVVFKPFWNVEKEQKWLNHMASNGYALIDYFWIRYVFEETPPGEYSYQIDLLEHSKRSPETELFFSFLQESGIEVVATYMRWAYLRKRSADGAFQLYSDKESRLAYLMRIRNFWIVLEILEIFAALTNVWPSVAFLFQIGYSQAGALNLVFFLICSFTVTAIFLGCLYPVLSQIKKIRNEMKLFE